MGGVHADPEELRNFANMLAEYINTLEDATNQIYGGFESLSDSWQDEKRNAFEDEFKVLIDQISQFKSSCEEQVPYLHNLANILDGYQTF